MLTVAFLLYLLEVEETDFMNKLVHYLIKWDINIVGVTYCLLFFPEKEMMNQL